MARSGRDARRMGTYVSRTVHARTTVRPRQGRINTAKEEGRGQHGKSGCRGRERERRERVTALHVPA